MRGGASRYCRKKVLSHRTEKKSLVREPSCFPENFWYRKIFMGKRGGGGFITIFRRNFCLTVPKNFVGEPFNVSENFEYRKILCIRRRYHNFPLKIFCLSVPKNFVGEPFLFSENFGYRNFSCIREGRCRDFPSS